MEITFGVSKNYFVHELTDNLITELKTTEHLQRLQTIHELIKQRVDDEKQRRTDKLNITRGKSVESPEKSYIKTTYSNKWKPKYFKV